MSLRSERMDDPQRLLDEGDTSARQRQRWGVGVLILGLVLGFALGLAYTWLVNPVLYLSTTPASLGPDAKDTYRVTIAESYAATGNLDRAHSRLVLLEDPNPGYALGAQAQRSLGGGFPAEAQALAQLASDIQAD